jgi:NADH:ubiquinone oxidoreductase subunit E
MENTAAGQLLFICCSPKSCGPRGAEDNWQAACTHLDASIHEEEIRVPGVTVQRKYCLGECEHGPNGRIRNSSFGKDIDLPALTPQQVVAVIDQLRKNVL